MDERPALLADKVIRGVLTIPRGGKRMEKKGSCESEKIEKRV